jgi:hypothetical protein
MESVLNHLSSALGRRDEVPNQELAQNLVKTRNEAGIKELVENLNHAKKAIQQDCIKTLYEVGALQPDLIAPYATTFIKLLSSTNNRLQWGAMTTIQTISHLKPEEIYQALPKILEVADKGSVITKDQSVSILIKLCSFENYLPLCFPLLKEQILKSLPNQLPMYAERALEIVNAENKLEFIKTLEARLNDLEKESKKKRLEKVIRKAHNFG